MGERLLTLTEETDVSTMPETMAEPETTVPDLEPDDGEELSLDDRIALQKLAVASEFLKARRMAGWVRRQNKTASIELARLEIIENERHEANGTSPSLPMFDDVGNATPAAHARDANAA